MSIRSKNIEAALSLEKLISEYSYLFHELLKNFLPQTENEEKFIHSLIIRIYRIQKKILQIWEQNQQIFQDAHFQKQVDLVIKKYLQEKGL
ncbi:MAG: hypothetical protein RMI35_00495 [Leptospiraceae bacterium]|nr:hypothetical protein [Leptospiraceae bacterium]